MLVTEWLTFLTKKGLIDDNLTTRAATLAFVWSRSNVVDEFGKRRNWTTLSFTEFLEALVRCAEYKVYPTKEALVKSGVDTVENFFVSAAAVSEEMVPGADRPAGDSLEIMLRDMVES